MAFSTVSKPKQDITDALMGEMSNIFATVDSIDVDGIELKNISLRAGDKLLKLKVVEVDRIDVEDEIRREYKHILNTKLELIHENIKKKISDMVQFVQTYRDESERIQAELKKRLESSQIMPTISFRQAEKGLSISPGDRKNEIHWFVRSVYWPKFIDQIPIEQRYQKKLITPIVIMITTEGDFVKAVSTRTPIGLRYFSHYHQSEPDCWGRWKWPPKWKTADDIISIAREVEGVLENINTGSIAKRTPIGLPSLQIIMKHVTRKGESLKKEVDVANSRVGVTTTVTNISMEDSWST